ncbi:MAG: acyl-CoA dehydrogenase family protein [Polymorphobacter sp.]
MNFAFTDEQAMIADTARAFFSQNATSARTRAAMAADGIDRALWHSFTAELGLGGIALPEAHGGAGLGMVELAILSEAAGAHVAALPLLGTAMAAQAIAAGGSQAQKAQWLPGLIAGTSIGAPGSSETASVAGNRISGTFDFIPHGASADLFVLLAGGSVWLVPADAPGLMVVVQTTMDQTRPFARLVLADTPASPLDSSAGILRASQAGWLIAAAEALGGAQSCLDLTIAYANQRIQFGRPIGSFQAYKHRLADMMIEIEQARSAVWWAACALDEAADDVDIALHSAKSFATDTFAMCAGNMIQLHGGIGFTWDHDAHLFFKRSRALQSMLGSNAWHREQIAQQIGLAA